MFTTYDNEYYALLCCVGGPGTPGGHVTPGPPLVTGLLRIIRNVVRPYATGCDGKDLGHGARYGITDAVESPAFGDLRTLGRIRSDLFVVAGWNR